jgi:protein phosphatase
MRTFSKTDTGVKREMNQDYFFSSETAVGNLPNLFLVADGMGGHKAGEYASRYTIERIVASVSRNTGKEPVKIFKEAIRKANDLLIAEAREDETKNGMGTTLVAATIIGHRLFVANVGDSRLYVISDRIRQITKDHSLVEEMVRLGEMAESEARKHPRKNIITRAIGAADQVEADFFEVELGEKDTILLCSDGLTNMVEDSAIEEIIFAKENVETKVNTLIQNANANGGRDNITATIIEPFSDEVKTC